MDRTIDIDPDIRRARTLPSWCYRDTATFEWLRERVFLRSWQFVGDDALVPSPGTVHPFTFLDHALRRRFAFIRLTPNHDALHHYLIRTGQLQPGNPHQEQQFQTLLTILRQINNHIADPHHALGHAHFMQPNLAADLPHIWRYEIEPYLEEQFFDQPAQIQPLRWTNIRQQFTSES